MTFALYNSVTAGSKLCFYTIIHLLTRKYQTGIIGTVSKETSTSLQSEEAEGKREIERLNNACVVLIWLFRGGKDQKSLFGGSRLL